MKRKKYAFFWIIPLAIALAGLCSSYVFGQTPEERIGKAEKNYASSVDNFNGEIEIIVDEFGAPVTEKILLLPDKDIKVPVIKGEPPREELTWKDVAQYENQLAKDPDPYVRWYVENVWIDRINKVLALLEEKLKEKYPDRYAEINVAVKDITDALGMQPAIGFLTSETFVKIPNSFGGKVPNVDPALAEFLDEPLEELETLETEIEIPETPASPSS